MSSISPQVIVHLRQGKNALRQERRGAPLEEKLRQLVQAQHLYVQIVGSRKALNPLQRPWNILSDVKDAVVIRPEGVESTEAPIGVSRSQWICLRSRPL